MYHKNNQKDRKIPKRQMNSMCKLNNNCLTCVWQNVVIKAIVNIELLKYAWKI